MYKNLTKKQEEAIEKNFVYHAWKVKKKIWNLEIDDILQELRLFVLEKMHEFNSKKSSLFTYINNQIKYGAFRVYKNEIKKYINEKNFTNIKYELNTKFDNGKFDIDLILPGRKYNYDFDIELKEIKQELVKINCMLVEIFNLLLDGVQKKDILKKYNFSYHDLERKVFDIRRVILERENDAK